MKRADSCYPNNVKRIKLQQDLVIDDIWGEDPDCDEVDKCIDLATQLCSQVPVTTHDTLNFTSYEDFRKNKISASTQLFFAPSTSAVKSSSHSSVHTVINSSDNDIRKLLQKINNLEFEKKKLAEAAATKDGEISILRSQLKDVKKTVDNEKMEKMKTIQENQQQFNKKITAVTKDLNTYKCELDFKNLEIANLREKITELKKVCNSTFNQSILQEELNSSQVFHHPKKSCNQQLQTEVSNTLLPSQITNYPLKILIPKSIFEKSSERNSALKLYNNKKIVSLYTNDISILLGINSQPTIKTQNCNFSISDFFPEIQNLIFCSSHELNNSENVLKFIATILSHTKVSLKHLLCQLNEIYSKLTFEDVEDRDNLYLQKIVIEYKTDCIFSGNLWHENESGVEIRRFIAFLSSLICVCKNLCTYFCTEYPREYFENDSLIPYEFLNNLLQIVTVIKNTRWSEQFCGLVSSILQFLANLSSSETLPSSCCNIIFKIFQQIIFSRPRKPILKYVTVFLKHISMYEIFTSQLCFMKNCQGTQCNIKDGLLLFSEETCAFRILTTELETCELDTQMVLNIMQFLVNSLNCNVQWLYNVYEKRCDCLNIIFDFGLDILFKTVIKHSENITTDTTIHHTIFRIGLVFLEKLTEKIPYTLQKFSASQFLTIIRYISTLKHHEIKNLESALSNEAQQQSKNSNADYIFNNCF